MYNLIDELSEKFRIFSKIDKYAYSINVKDGMTESATYKVTNENLLYIADNGSPRNMILPSNINRRLQEWFKSEIELLIVNDLYEHVVDDDYKEDYILDCFEKYKPMVEQWYKNEIRKMNVLDIDMRKFSEQISCKIIHKDI